MPAYPIIGSKVTVNEALPNDDGSQPSVPVDGDVVRISYKQVAGRSLAVYHVLTADGAVVKAINAGIKLNRRMPMKPRKK